MSLDHEAQRHGSNSGSIGQANRVGDGFHLHLFHHLATVELDSLFGVAHIRTGLFVQMPIYPTSDPSFSSSSNNAARTESNA